MTLPPQPARRSFGRYEILRTLGQGGMGEVFLARLTGAAGFEKLCVIKTILPSLTTDPDFKDRFRHEAAVLTQLNHSSIADVYDMGEEPDGTRFMVLEYVPGVELSVLQERARSYGIPVPFEIALHIGQRVADALAYVHRRADKDGNALGLVHRDVSPQNVMVSYDGEVKVIDFGLAKSSARSRKTGPSTMLGKLGYMSPEQAKAQPVDTRTDIYSCGLIVWELLAGQPFFDGSGSVGEMLAAMSSPPHRPLSGLRREVTPELEAAIQRALAPDREDRFARADDFARALTEQLVLRKSVVGSEQVGAFVRHLCPTEIEGQKQLIGELATIGPRSVTPTSGPSLGAEIDLSKERSGRERASETAPLDATLIRPSRKGPWIALGVLAALGAVSAFLWRRTELPHRSELTEKPLSSSSQDPGSGALSRPAEMSEKEREKPPHKKITEAPRAGTAEKEKPARTSPGKAEEPKGTQTAAVGGPGKPPNGSKEDNLTMMSELVQVSPVQWRVVLRNTSPVRWTNCDLDLASGHKYRLAKLERNEWKSIPIGRFKADGEKRYWPQAGLRSTCAEGSASVEYPKGPASQWPSLKKTKAGPTGDLEGHAEVGRVIGTNEWRILVYNEGDVHWTGCVLQLPDGKRRTEQRLNAHGDHVYRLMDFGEKPDQPPPEEIKIDCSEGKSVFPLVL